MNSKGPLTVLVWNKIPWYPSPPPPSRQFIRERGFQLSWTAASLIYHHKHFATY